jgi:hypothetical protein
MNTHKKIVRTGDLVPKGIKSTVKEQTSDFNTVMNHLWKQIRTF